MYRRILASQRVTMHVGPLGNYTWLAIYVQWLHRSRGKASRVPILPRELLKLSVHAQNDAVAGTSALGLVSGWLSLLLARLAL